MINKDYLPSKEFIHRVIVIAIAFAIVLGIYGIVKFFKNRSKNNAPLNLVIKDSVAKDSNSNGIPDWEETLWGLNPEKNGPENKEFILAKRQSIAADRPDLVSDGKPQTENEALSREFFAVIMSLQQSGKLDETSIQAVSNAIGKKVVATPIPDIYTKSMVTLRESTTNTISDYYAAHLNLLLKYDGKSIGDELIFVNQALQNNDQHALDATQSIADAYKDFAKEFVKIPVPSTLLSAHLAMANDYEKVGETIEGMITMFTDPVNGMKSFINYKKYSDALADDIDRLSGN